jgi:hypothetical protein
VASYSGRPASPSWGNRSQHLVAVAAGDPGPDDLTPSENECTRSGSEEYVSVKGWRPDDLPDELLGIDEHDCLGRQCSCGSGASCRKVIRQDHGRFGAKWHLERTPKQIYATARE